VSELVDLGFGKVDIVLAVPDSWDDVSNVGDLFNKFNAPGQQLRIWSEYLNLTEEFVFEFQDVEPTILSPYQGLSRGRHSPVIIFHSFGATESKPPEDGEAIVDNTATGTTLKQNGLKIIRNILSGSTARLLVNNRSAKDPKKQQTINAIAEACAKAAPAASSRTRGLNGHLSW
jgi:ATP phosphoribosyltransferase